MNNFLSQLPNIVGRRKKRVGRGIGSGKGSKSGRGTTRHQKARESIPSHFEGGQGRMVKKFPLLRGKGRNKSSDLPPIVVDIAKLNIFATGEKITVDALIKKGLVDSLAKKTGVKILGKEKLEKKLHVAVATSKSAKILIEKLGGKVD